MQSNFSSHATTASSSVTKPRQHVILQYIYISFRIRISSTCRASSLLHVISNYGYFTFKTQYSQYPLNANIQVKTLTCTHWLWFVFDNWICFLLHQLQCEECITKSFIVFFQGQFFEALYSNKQTLQEPDKLNVTGCLHMQLSKPPAYVNFMYFMYTCRIIWSFKLLI